MIVRYFNDAALFCRELLFQELRQMNLPHETDSLRVFPFCRSQAMLTGNVSHFMLHKGSDRKNNPAELFLRKLAKEVTLVLTGILSLKQAADGRSIDEEFLLAAIVAGGNIISTLIQSRL
jgi:hypothetical protein